MYIMLLIDDIVGNKVLLRYKGSLGLSKVYIVEIEFLKKRIE